jgi:hypothetical protein
MVFSWAYARNRKEYHIPQKKDCAEISVHQFIEIFIKETIYKI